MRAALLPLMFCIGCGGAPAPAANAPKETPAMPHAADPIETTRALCELMTRNGLSVTEAQAALSASGDAALRTAVLLPAPDADEPALASFTPAGHLAPERLDAAFGERHEAPRLHWDAPAEYLYYPDAPAERAFTCAVIGRVTDAGVVSVAVRRDPRL